MSQTHQAVFVIRKINTWWFVETPDESRVGPFLPKVVLEAAVTRAVLARRRGLDARIFVRDEYGGTHNCPIIEEMNNPTRCQKCESAWQASSALPVRCALRAALN